MGDFSMQELDCFDKTNDMEKSPHPNKKLSPLDYKLFDVIYISDDFNDDLGDEFWFGENQEGK